MLVFRDFESDVFADSATHFGCKFLVASLGCQTRVGTLDDLKYCRGEFIIWMFDWGVDHQVVGRILGIFRAFHWQIRIDGVCFPRVD